MITDICILALKQQGVSDEVICNALEVEQRLLIHQRCLEKVYNARERNRETHLEDAISRELKQVVAG